MTTPVFMRTSLQINAKQFLQISQERTSRFSCIPKDIISYVLLPLIQNPFTVCQEDQYYYTDVKRLSPDQLLHFTNVRILSMAILDRNDVFTRVFIEYGGYIYPALTGKEKIYYQSIRDEMAKEAGNRKS